MAEAGQIPASASDLYKRWEIIPAFHCKRSPADPVASISLPTLPIHLLSTAMPYTCVQAREKRTKYW